MCSMNTIPHLDQIVGAIAHSWSASPKPMQKKRTKHGSSLILGDTSIASKALYTIIFVMMLASKIEVAMAQALQICSCSPPTYRWKLNFSRGCPLQITPRGGTKDPFCTYDDFSDDFVGSFTPVVITDMFLVDLDQELSGVKTLRVTDTSLNDGDIITFESITSLNSEIKTGGLQGQLRAVNAEGSAFTLSFLIRFSNICEILPFHVGDSLGFLEFDEIEQPRAESCNFSSVSPSSLPSYHPTGTPTLAPTKSPTPIPTKQASASPSSTPTKGPTRVPTFSPTNVPSITPTKSPTNNPTVAPTKSVPPTPKPTGRGKEFTPAPTTPAPTTAPTIAPTGSGSTEPSSYPSLDCKGKGKGSSKGKGKGKGESSKKTNKNNKGKGKSAKIKCTSEENTPIQPMEEFGFNINDIILKDPLHHHGGLRGLKRINDININ